MRSLRSSCVRVSITYGRSPAPHARDTTELSFPPSTQYSTPRGQSKRHFCMEIGDTPIITRVTATGLVQDLTPFILDPRPTPHRQRPDPDSHRGCELPPATGGVPARESAPTACQEPKIESAARLRPSVAPRDSVCDHAIEVYLRRSSLLPYLQIDRTERRTTEAQITKPGQTNLSRHQEVPSSRMS